MRQNLCYHPWAFWCFVFPWDMHPVAWFPTILRSSLFIFIFEMLRQSFYIAQVGLELINLFSHLPHWGHRYVPPHLATSYFFKPSLLYSLQSWQGPRGHFQLALPVPCLPTGVWSDCQMHWKGVWCPCMLQPTLLLHSQALLPAPSLLLSHLGSS